MKYKLVNNVTKEETICDKVVVDGFDYYVSDNCNDLGGWHIDAEFKLLLNASRYNVVYPMKKIIATNNPNISIPKVIDEVEMLSYKFNPLKKLDGEFLRAAFKSGYNKSQETHPNSDENMIEFVEWCDTSEEAAIFWRRNKVDPTMNNSHLKIIKKKRKELLQLWKSQQIKTIYYE